MFSIGNQLREARSKKTLSLDDVYSRIKIHPRVLNLLEEGRFEKLPSPLFTKSFLKTYAEFLELNSENLIQAYEKEDKKDPEQVLFIKPVDQKAKKNPSVNIFPAVAALFLIMAVGFGALHLFKAAAHLLNKKSTEKIEQKNLDSRSRHFSAGEPKTEWLRSPEQGNFPKIKPKTPLELKIHATDNVWLHITCDGKVLFQSILKRGASESWTANQSIEIWTGNPASMNLTLNRLNLGSPGKGVTKKMVLSRDGLRLVA